MASKPRLPSGTSRTTSKLASLHRIVQDVSRAPELNEALRIIVRGVRETLNVDACSVYLTDQTTRSHLLRAAEGLDPRAVGEVRLAFEEGLVGLVASRSQPVNVDDAPSHPNYKFVPSSGEDVYHGFLGVPVIHDRQLLGVLVVQQVAAHRFKGSDGAFLVTLAAQLAGLLAFVRASSAVRSTASQIQYVEGIAGSPGVAIGLGVVVYSAVELETVPDRGSEDPQAEEMAFRAAVVEVIDEFQRLGSNTQAIILDENRALFEAYAMIAGSDMLVDPTVQRIRAGNWPPGALRETIQEHMRQFEAMDDPYIRDRARDIRAIGQRILAQLQRKEKLAVNYPENTILVGEDLSPIELADVPAHRLAGVVSGHGAGCSHLSILAHAMGIPAVVGMASKLPVSQLDGRELVVDGYRGRLYVDPSDSARREFVRLAREERELSEQLQDLRDQPASTPDGFKISLYTNVGISADFSNSLEVGTEGIGLYRTELPFMLREQFPTEEEQRVMYRHVLEPFAPRPVIMRTLDVGGDKALTYLPVVEVNPALGWRGIRVTLDHPEIFLIQLRAMFRAAEGLNNLRVLFPMISSVGEVDEAIALLQRAFEQMKEEGIDVRMPPLGIMIEVPAAVYQADALARRVDFLSVGTNDLTQYMLAVDRGNERVAELFDSLHPAVLRALSQVVEAGQRNDTPVNVCGEVAGDPAAALLLLGMGVHGLSMSAGDLPRIKWVIRSFSRQRARELLEQALEYETATLIRQMLTRILEAAGLGGLVRPGK